MTPSTDQWLREAKLHASAPKIGMYLLHNGTVRQTAKAAVRYGDENVPTVTGMSVSCDQPRLDAAIADTYRMAGIYYIRAWVNTGRLAVGDDLMYVLIGGDIRPRVVDAMQYLLGRIKRECIVEEELYDTPRTADRPFSS